MRQKIFIALFALFLTFSAGADAPNMLVTARTDTNEVVLSWVHPYNARQAVRIFRKLPNDEFWGDPVFLGENVSTWTDRGGKANTLYKYLVIHGLNFGVVWTGRGLDVVDNRGKVLLVVDSRFKESLGPHLSKYIDYLAGDGFEVLVSIYSPPAEGVNQYFDFPDQHGLRVRNPAWSGQVKVVREIIQKAHAQNPDLAYVIFFGHMPVPYSGYANDSGHTGAPLNGAITAEAVYMDLDGNWTDVEPANPRFPASWAENGNIPGDGKFDNNFVPSAPEVILGRIDMADLPLANLLTYSESDEMLERELLKRYIYKNLDYRLKNVSYPHRVLNEHYIPNEPTGLRFSVQSLFEPGSGPGTGGSIYDDFDFTRRPYPQNKWFPVSAQEGFFAYPYARYPTGVNLQNTPYFWASANGRGYFDEFGTLGALFGRSSHFAEFDTLAPFVTLSCSFMFDWANRAGALRSKTAVQGCKAATTGNLDQLAGFKLIDGVQVSDGDRVLVKDQNQKKENGIYIARAGRWERAPDSLTTNQRVDRRVRISNGLLNRNSWFSCRHATEELGTYYFKGPGSILTAPLVNLNTLATFSSPGMVYLNPMGAGETLGMVFKETYFVNGERFPQTVLKAPRTTAAYSTNSRATATSISVSLLGDPTLRRMNVPAPASLFAFAGKCDLQWTAPADRSFTNYLVYGAESRTGPYHRITKTPVASSKSLVRFKQPGVSYNYYQVKAVASVTTPSATYLDSSQGVISECRFLACKLSDDRSKFTCLLAVPGASRFFLLEQSRDGNNWTPAGNPVGPGGKSPVEITMATAPGATYYRARSSASPNGPAQEYSANIIGYTVVQVPGGGKRALLANEFNKLRDGRLITNPDGEGDVRDAGLDANTVARLFPKDSVKDKSVIRKWNPEKERWTDYVYTADKGGWPEGARELELNPGEAFEFENNSPEAQAVWFCGEIPEGNRRLAIRRGVSFIGSIRPNGTRKISDIFRNYIFSPGDVIERFDRVKQKIDRAKYSAEEGWDDDMTIPNGEGFSLETQHPGNWDEIVSLW